MSVGSRGSWYCGKCPPRPPDKPYLCYVHREGRSISDLMLLVCEGDHALGPLLADILAGRTFLRAEVFDGDRRVLVRHPQP